MPSNIQVVPEYEYTLPVVGFEGNVNGIICIYKEKVTVPVPAVNDNILDPTTAVVLLVNVRPADTVAVYTLGILSMTMPEPPAPDVLKVLEAALAVDPPLPELAVALD